MRKKSNVEKGNDFEDEVGEIIEDLLKKGDLAIAPESYIIKKKPKYYNTARNKKIEFDWSIEVRPNKADNIQFLYIIECKNYAGSIDANKLESTQTQVQNIRIEGCKVVTKIIFICKGKITETLSTLARTDSVMLIHVVDGSCKIIHYRKQRKANNSNIIKIQENLNWKSKLKEKLVNYITNSNKINFTLFGLRKLNKKEIKEIAEKEFNKLNPSVLKKENLIEYLKTEHRIGIKYLNDRKVDNSALGFYDKQEQTIFINKQIKNTDQELFTIAHEIGHVVLHQDIYFKEGSYFDYLSSEDSIFNKQEEKYELKNDKNFIEFQANCFAANFLLNENIFRRTLIEEQLSLGISRGRTGYIYLDKQKNNILDYRLIRNSLAKLFNVTPRIIDIHLKNLNMLKKGE